MNASNDRRGRRILFLVFVVVSVVAGLGDVARAQSTYTWNVTNGTWGTAGNWTPTRTTPATTDILVFDGNVTAAPTVTSVVNQTIGKLVFRNNVNAALSSPPPTSTTLNIAGGTGVDLEVQAGSTVRITGSFALSISLGVSATGSIGGNVIVQAPGARFLSNSAMALVFTGGSQVIASPGFTGNLFGNALQNAVVFQNGSAYNSHAGNDPFARVPPQSVVIFETGSIYRHFQTAAASLAGRTYADFELGEAGYNVTTTNGPALTVDNLSIQSGTAHLQLPVNIKGNVFVNGAGNLDFNPVTAQLVRMNGTASQSVTRLGTLSFNGNSTFSIENTAGVVLEDQVTLGGTTHVTSGTLLTLRDAVTNTGTMNVDGTLQLESAGGASGNAFLYGPTGTLVFNNFAQIEVSDEPYWIGAAAPPNVTIQGGNPIIIETQVPVITGALTLTNGTIANAFPLVIGPTGSVFGGSASSHVRGRLQKYVATTGSPTSVEFEIGDGNVYSPVTIEPPSVTTGGYLAAMTQGLDHALISISGLDESRSVNRHWILSNVNAVLPPCAVTFNFDPVDLDPGTDPSTFVVKKWDESSWTTPTIGTRTPTNTQITDVASFSEFAIANRAWVIETSYGPNGGIFPNLTIYVQNGQDQQFLMEPFPSYVVEDVLVDGVSVGAVNEYTFTNVTADHTIHATFTQMPFTDIDAGLPGVEGASARWGDYDADGDLDLLLVGHVGVNNHISRVYENESGTFTDIQAGLTGVMGAAAWGDYDGDGDLDILLSGYDGTAGISRVYRNDNGAFVDINAGLLDLFLSSVAWGDCDNDGDLDIVLTGATNVIQWNSRIYRNDSGTFVDLGASLTDVANGAVAWSDYDGDGDNDLLLTGESQFGPYTGLYRNDGGSFVDSGVVLPGVQLSAVAWGDYDTDGDPDILLTGQTMSGHISRIYGNTGGAFADIGAGLVGVAWSTVAFGDYDNDGDPDILLSGHDGTFTLYTIVYRNDGTSFVDIGAGLGGTQFGTAAWGDYDNDGDLDFLLGGNISAAVRTQIFRNNAIVPNSSPSAPTSLSANVAGSTATFSWAAASDAQTPAAGLSYNLRVGTTPGGNEISSAMANAVDGYRMVPQFGNAGQRLSWTLTLPAPCGTYYWSVQAVDAAFAGSSFAPEATIQPGSQNFIDIAAGLPDLSNSSCAWGDYDNDGDLDLVLAGTQGSALFRNDAGTFNDAGAGLPTLQEGSLSWGDYDNDGDLDLLVSGSSQFGTITRIYRNDSASLVDIGASLAGQYKSATAWGDYDNDGDLDLVLTGTDNSQVPQARIYRNDSGTFVEIGAGLPGVAPGSVAWGDYDNDGDLDLVLCGLAAGAQRLSRIYRNDSGIFTDIVAGLPGAHLGTARWGDYDNDGDLDLLLVGFAGGGLSSIYRNDSGVFVDIGAGLRGLYFASAEWGDYDNDGDLDVVLTGFDFEPVSKIYRNDASTFVDTQAALERVFIGASAWGDYDSDGDLDLVLTGAKNGGQTSKIYRNGLCNAANTPPAAPSGLSVSHDGPVVSFSWSAASDAETPSAGLTYNLVVGSTPGGNDLMSPMAELATGYRRVAQIGNVNHNLTWDVEVPLGASVYWSVQAIDAGFMGSAFATGQEVTETEQDELPARSALLGGRPNPFRTSTNLEFALPAPGLVKLRVFDVQGRLVRLLKDGVEPAGRRIATWDGFNDQGKPVGSGVYVIQLDVAGKRHAQRVVRLQ